MNLPIALKAPAGHVSFARRPSGFSLLEVIIATGILAASTLLLLSLLSTGERHARRAERQVIAQMLCQSKLDELIADPSQLRLVENEPDVENEDWVFTVEWTPTQIQGLVRLRVAVQPTETRERTRDVHPAARVFELVRWTRLRPDNLSTATRVDSGTIPVDPLPSQP